MISFDRRKLKYELRSSLRGSIDGEPIAVLLVMKTLKQIGDFFIASIGSWAVKLQKNRFGSIKNFRKLWIGAPAMA